MLMMAIVDLVLGHLSTLIDDYNVDHVEDGNSRPGRGDKFSWLAWLVLSWSRPGRSQQSGDQDSDHNMLVIRL